MKLPCSRLFYAALIVFAAALVGAANAHLVFVAMLSQPRCLEHVKLGETKAEAATFSAAKSSC